MVPLKTPGSGNLAGTRSQLGVGSGSARCLSGCCGIGDERSAAPGVTRVWTRNARTRADDGPALRTPQAARTTHRGDAERHARSHGRALHPGAEELPGATEELPGATEEPVSAGLQGCSFSRLGGRLQQGGGGV